MRAKYASLLHAPRPTSERPRMALDNRAKIFTPFSALRGFDISILTKDRDMTLTPRIALYDEIREALGRQLAQCGRGDTLRVTWFRPVRQVGDTEMGEYVTETAVIEGLDEVRQVLRIRGREVPFDDILALAAEEGP